MCLRFLVLAALALAACHSDSDSDPGPAPDPLVLNLALAGRHVIGTGELRLVLASEEAQGQDLDGDGDTTDVVVHLLDIGANNSFSNTGLALPHSLHRDEVPPPESVCNDALAAFVVSEAETGRDLDQDGTSDGGATWVFRRRTGELMRLPFAHAAVMLGGDLAAFLARDEAGSGRLALRIFDDSDGSLSQPALDLSGLGSVSDRIVTFTLAELGAVDLNADGDTTDVSVLHVYDADLRRVVNTGFDIVSEVRLAGGFVGFNTYENGHDLNGDGDDSGYVFVAVDVHSGLTRIPGFGQGTFGDFLGPDPERFVLVVNERGTDRNGDGDGDDDVALLYDPRSDRVTETGLATDGSMVSAGRWVGVSVIESQQGELDLDGNGDIAGHVLHVFDSRTGRSQNLGLQGGWFGTVGGQLLGAHFTFEGSTLVNELVVWDPRNLVGRRTGIDVRSVFGSSGARALVSLREHDEDLNGDGDVEDFVLALYDGRTGTVRSLGLATSVFEGRLAPDGQAAVLVSETAQGVDLNGDGDLLDQVLHQVYVDAPQQ